MRAIQRTVFLLLLGLVAGPLAFGASADELRRIKYNHPGLVVDLGVGLWAWPLPLDYDGDGDLDLVVSCPDKPYSGTYFFENPGGEKLPVFKPGRRVGPALRNVQFSLVDGKPRVLTPGEEVHDLRGGFSERTKIFPRANIHPGKVRANQWKYVDYDGDGAVDLVVGVGDWAEYGWDNAFDEAGNWTRGPLHGYVYLLRNRGANNAPEYAAAVKIQAAGKPVDVFGMPSPNFADFDGDGDLDLLCGEFLDGFSYFENTGTRTKPKYAAPRRLTHAGKPLAMDLQMITPTAIDWDDDGDIDLICGDEDGRVALIENTGKLHDGVPGFLPPVYFQQQADDVKFGALVTPVSVDWDGDGDEDLICGNTAGYVGLIENLDGGNPPRWAAPVYLQAGGEILRIQAGPNGSIQGPAEAKWGYTTLDVADWDDDGRPDLVVNSIWGKIVWYRNIGTRAEPKLAAAQPVRVAWNGRPPKPAWNWWDPAEDELATQWRTTPLVADWNDDGLADLIMLDHEGYLALFERKRDEATGQLVLAPGRRVFVDNQQQPLRLNSGIAGRSGRRKLCLVDYDGDRRRDLLVNTRNANLLRNLGTRDGATVLADQGPLDTRVLAGHTTSPTTVDWDGDGRRELLVGAEDGFLYYKQNSWKPKVRQSGDLKLQLQRSQLARLGNGAKAFGNRDYVWHDVPNRFQDWKFTRTQGGEPAHVRVTALADTSLRIATADGQRGVDLSGWDKKPELSFGYNDAGRTRMQIYSRAVKQGDTVVLPQGNWSGTLLLIPPDSTSAAKPASGRQSSQRKQKNVLFIGMDDMNMLLGCYGAKQIQSPRIDALAAGGLRFNRAYCQQAVCNPSRASLMTGLRPDTIRVWDLRTDFRMARPKAVTLPQYFRQHGYHAQCLGKMFHNTGGLNDEASWSVPARFHAGGHTDEYTQPGNPPGKKGLCYEWADLPDEAYRDGKIVDAAIDALKELRDQPFFLAVGLWRPHIPFLAPKKYWDLYDRQALPEPHPLEPPRGVPGVALHPNREVRGYSDVPNQAPIDAEQTRLMRHGYYASISYIDANIGRLLDALDRQGLADNTVIVLWSDHGYHLGERRLWCKTSCFELDARVPLIVVDPDRPQHAGRSTDALVELIDLYPSLAELCGLPAPADVEGRSFAPLFSEPQQKWKQAALTQNPRPFYGKAPAKTMGYSLRTENFRYTEWRSIGTQNVEASELYDHRNDPLETQNVVDEPDYEADVARLAPMLDAVLAGEVASPDEASR